MAKIEIALVRLVQFCLFVFYIYAALVYVGMVILVPLGGFYHLYNFLHLGLHGFIATLVALALVSGSGYVLSRIPKVLEIVRDSGLKLAELGIAQVQELGALARSLKPLGISAADLSQPSS